MTPSKVLYVTLVNRYYYYVGAIATAIYWACAGIEHMLLCPQIGNCVHLATAQVNSESVNNAYITRQDGEKQGADTLGVNG